MIPESFATARLQAERIAPGHFDALRVMDQDARMMEFIGGVRDEPGTAAYLERQMRQWQEHGYGFWMLTDAATGASAGRAGLRQLVLDDPEHPEVEMGYGFLPAYWGRGLATEIAGACLRFAFDGLGRASVVALTHPAHATSQHVLGKVGMTYERDVTIETRSMALFRGPHPAAAR